MVASRAIFGDMTIELRIGNHVAEKSRCFLELLEVSFSLTATVHLSHWHRNLPRKHLGRCKSCHHSYLTVALVICWCETDLNGRKRMVLPLDISHSG